MDDPKVLRARPRRRRPHRAAALVVVAVALLTVGAVQAGRVLDPPAPRPATGSSVRPVSTRPRPAAVSAGRATPIGRTITVITRDVDPGPTFDRVYLLPGKLDATQARDGLKPTIFVRPGERLRIRVDNQDSVDHTWTFAGTRVNVTAWAHTAVISQRFRAPTVPGAYDFFCAFRKAGMNGRVVVTN